MSHKKHTPLLKEFFITAKKNRTKNETKIIMRRNCKEELCCSRCRFNKDDDERSFLKPTSRSCGGGGGGSGSGESGSRSRLKRKQRGNFDGKKRGGESGSFLLFFFFFFFFFFVILLFFVFFFVCDNMKKVRGEKLKTTTATSND